MQKHIETINRDKPQINNHAQEKHNLYYMHSWSVDVASKEKHMHAADR